ncbi:molybdenum cofactor guanylyltransferase MobA [Albirhodobacter sp. R86504]|uniref:molybdenum cofactor guanylyltransferase MobA n=1 Tax=Albirhodobacter sp. R86504 TaxID=3093848 RepID=UPI00366FF2E9
MRLVALVLAGGEARRMGGVDKALLDLGGAPLITHVLRRLAPQIAPVAISFNGDATHIAHYSKAILRDTVVGQGPLGGVLAGLTWAAGIGADALVTVPVDTPFIPLDLVARLRAASVEGGASYARSVDIEGEMRAHPAVALWPVSMRADISQALGDGERRLRIALKSAAHADFHDIPDPFTNLNTPEDLARARSRMIFPPGGESHDI